MAYADTKDDEACLQACSKPRKKAAIRRTVAEIFLPNYLNGSEVGQAEHYEDSMFIDRLVPDWKLLIKS